VDEARRRQVPVVRVSIALALFVQAAVSVVVEVGFEGIYLGLLRFVGKDGHPIVLEGQRLHQLARRAAQRRGWPPPEKATNVVVAGRIARVRD
jgi:hypothetical protein